MTDILANRRQNVNDELGRRVDISTLGTAGAPSRIDLWLWASILNVGMTYDFPEAQATLTGQWQQGMDSIVWPPEARGIDSIKFYWPNGTAIRTYWKDIDYLRRYPAGPVTIPVTFPLVSVGPPSITADHNNQIFIRPYADSVVYNYILDYFQKPFQAVGQSSVDPPYTAVGTSDIGATPVMVGDDWLEIIDYGAMMRGHIALGEPEKAQSIQQLLFGFTMPQTGKQVPGLIAQALTRRQLMAPRMDYGVQPRQAKRSYTNVV